MERYLTQYIAREDVSVIVVGKPLKMNGAPSETMRFVLPLVAVREGGLRLSFGLSHPLMKKFLIMALPLMIGQSVVVLDEQFVRILRSFVFRQETDLAFFDKPFGLAAVGSRGNLIVRQYVLIPVHQPVRMVQFPTDGPDQPFHAGYEF